MLTAIPTVGMLGVTVCSSNLSLFRHINPPKIGERDYESQSQSFAVSMFNRIQEKTGEKTCSGFAARQWLHDHHCKLALQRNKSDYCDTCKGLKDEIYWHNPLSNA